jgi:hypothetical protein
MLMLLLCAVFTLLQGKVATAAREESKKNWITKLGKQLVNSHKKIFKVTAAAQPRSSVSQPTALHEWHSLSCTCTCFALFTLSGL